MSDPKKYQRQSVDVLTIDHEALLWKLGILNMTDSLGLSRAAYFYFCKAFGVYSRHAIRDVIREQFRLGEDDVGRFVEFVDFEKLDRDDSGTTAIQPTRRVVHYDDPANNCSVYKIMATYMAYIPGSGEYFRKPQSASIDCQNPIQFSSRPIGINLLSHYLSDMMKAAGFIKEHFTTQSIKTAVVSILFRLGIDEDITRQRTRWWGPSGRVGSIRHTLAGANTSAGNSMDAAGQSDHEKLVTISRLLDPPPFTPLDRSSREAVMRSMGEVQLVTVNPERLLSSDDTALHSPSTTHSEMSTPVQLLPPIPQLENRLSHHHKEQTSQHVDTYKWFSETSSYGAESESEDSFLPKRPRLVSQPKSPERQSTSGSHREFVAMSGPRLDCSVIPKLITKSPVIKLEPDDDDDDDCVVVSSICDRSYTMQEQKASSSSASPAKRSATSSISSSSSGQESHNPDRCRPAVRNQMHCLTNGEMKEATSRPPKEGTSTLSVAFKFAYEIDHNGEVAASREVRALHTTTKDTSVKRRLLPMNVVDSSGQEATERQEELPNFSIRLSDFFPSVSRQKIDIRDVVIRGSRGQGTDRLNVELVVAECAGSEREAQITEPFDY